MFDKALTNNDEQELCLTNNDIEMYSTYNEGKFAISKRFIRILRNKIYKYMTSISKKSIY